MSTLARRVGVLETSLQDDFKRRWVAAIEALKETLAPEHARLIADWMRGAAARPRGQDHGHDHGHDRVRVCKRCILETDPPALVRAALIMLLHYVQGGAPVALPPHVAEVYLADPDAFPTLACEDCGYLMPTRGRLRPDGSFRHIAGYVGECPVCGRDTNPEEITP